MTSRQSSQHAGAVATVAVAMMGVVWAGPFRSLDTTVGFRVDSEVTIKVGYSAVSTWGAEQIDHQAGASLMWSRRWW